MPKCMKCGDKMYDGYYVESSEYYCSKDCLHEYYTKEEYEHMYECDIAYYTTWEEEDGLDDWDNEEEEVIIINGSSYNG